MIISVSSLCQHLRGGRRDETENGSKKNSTERNSEGVTLETQLLQKQTHQDSSVVAFYLSSESNGSGFKS